MSIVKQTVRICNDSTNRRAFGMPKVRSFGEWQLWRKNSNDRSWPGVRCQSLAPKQTSPDSWFRGATTFERLVELTQSARSGPSLELFGFELAHQFE